MTATRITPTNPDTLPGAWHAEDAEREDEGTTGGNPEDGTLQVHISGRHRRHAPRHPRVLIPVVRCVPAPQPPRAFEGLPT